MSRQVFKRCTRCPNRTRLGAGDRHCPTCGSADYTWGFVVDIGDDPVTRKATPTPRWRVRHPPGSRGSTAPNLLPNAVVPVQSSVRVGIVDPEQLSEQLLGETGPLIGESHRLCLGPRISDQTPLMQAVRSLPGEGLPCPPAVLVLVCVEMHQRKHGVLDTTLVVHHVLDDRTLGPTTLGARGP